MMNCDIIRDLLPLYADGLASSASRTLVEEHILTCPECRQLRDEMCAPLEPEPVDEEQKIMEILRIQRRKQRLRAILPWVLAILLCMTGWWIFMESHFYGEEIVLASTDEDVILKEIPELALTDAEKELAKTILEVDMFRDAFSDDSLNFTHFEYEDVRQYLASVIPEDAEIMEICVYGSSVHIQYLTGEMMTMLDYIDGDMTGHVDQIYKLKAVTPYEEVGGVKYAGDVDEVYSLTYAVGSGLTRYEKTESKHMWFSFLDMP